MLNQSLKSRAAVRLVYRVVAIASLHKSLLPFSEQRSIPDSRSTTTTLNTDCAKMDASQIKKMFMSEGEQIRSLRFKHAMTMLDKKYSKMPEDDIPTPSPQQANATQLAAQNIREKRTKKIAKCSDTRFKSDPILEADLAARIAALNVSEASKSMTAQWFLHSRDSNSKTEDKKSAGRRNRTGNELYNPFSKLQDDGQSQSWEIFFKNTTFSGSVLSRRPVIALEESQTSKPIKFNSPMSEPFSPRNLAPLSESILILREVVRVETPTFIPPASSYSGSYKYNEPSDCCELSGFVGLSQTKPNTMIPGLPFHDLWIKPKEDRSPGQPRKANEIWRPYPESKGRYFSDKIFSWGKFLFQCQRTCKASL